VSGAPVQVELEALAAAVGEALLQRGERLATAESCTGGWIGQCCTAIAGSSNWFDRGFITYSNEAKQEMLGVPRHTLRSEGAVSEATAGAMVQGAIARSRAQWALAVSGIAGPTGGTPAKPVGTVCFAWAGPEDWVALETCHFAGDREAVRAQTVAHALAVLLQRLQAPVLA
jgi:nicotinamide-nucleotide amidase